MELKLFINANYENELPIEDIFTFFVFILMKTKKIPKMELT